MLGSVVEAGEVAMMTGSANRGDGMGTCSAETVEVWTRDVLLVEILVKQLSNSQPMCAWSPLHRFQGSHPTIFAGGTVLGARHTDTAPEKPSRSHTSILLNTTHTRTTPNNKPTGYRERIGLGLTRRGPGQSDRAGCDVQRQNLRPCPERP